MNAKRFRNEDAPGNKTTHELGKHVPCQNALKISPVYSAKIEEGH